MEKDDHLTSACSGSPKKPAPADARVIRNNVIIIHLNVLTPATYLVTILLHDL
jgi:hypothetical protein